MTNLKQHLQVIDCSLNDNSVFYMCGNKMREMKITRHSLVMLNGFRCSLLACIVEVDESCPSENVKVGSLLRARLHVNVSDFIAVKRCSDKVSPCKEIILKASSHTVQNFNG